jgi:glycosyltransferase involved in cell wall biosynthesis
MPPEGVAVDLWALGRTGHIIQRPLIEALLAAGPVELRAILSDAGTDLADMKRLPLPMLVLAAAGRPSDLAGLGFRLWPARRRLARFEAGRKRLVHIVMGSRWDLFYLSVAKRAGATILLSIHDAARHPGEESRLLQALTDRAIRLSDHVAALSRHVCDTLAEKWPGKPVHFVPNGLILATRPPSPPRAFPFGRPLRLLFLGRIVHYKGLDILLDALALLRRDGADVQLTIAGAGDLAPYQLQLDALDCVTIRHGWYSDEEKWALLAESDVNLLPYREASQSGIALDGLVAALPSIATRLPGLTGQLGENGDTLFADNPSAETFAGLIGRLASDPALYERLSKGASASAAGRPEQAAAEWIALYREIAPR